MVEPMRFEPIPGSSMLKGNCGSSPNSAPKTRSERLVTSPVSWSHEPVRRAPSLE